MATATAAPGHKVTHAKLKQGVLAGSAYCALALANRIRATSVDDLILELGGLPDDKQAAETAFNAAADGFNVFDDARCRGHL